MKTILKMTVIMTLLPMIALAQGAFEKRSFTSSRGTELLYRELTPECNSESKSYPLVIFMHGAGERGSDNEAQLFHGSNMFLSPVNREEYPAYVLFPQCPEDRYWAMDKRPANFSSDSMPTDTEPSVMVAAAKELLDSYIKDHNIDTKRIYIIGLSMGGMATYDMTIRYPELFAAAVPICGATNGDRVRQASGIDKVKFRIFHGDKDDTVHVEGSRSAYRALKEAGADVRYREFVGCNHNSWDSAFNEDDFMSWLFDQHR